MNTKIVKPLMRTQQYIKYYKSSREKHVARLFNQKTPVVEYNKYLNKKDIMMVPKNEAIN